MRSQTKAANAISSPKSRRILVVDTQAISVLAIQMILQKLPDSEVLMACSGEQALLQAKGQPLDLLITDHSMFGIDGLTLGKQIRQLYPEIAIIMITAIDSDEVCEQAACLAIHTVLNKLVMLAKLGQVAAEALNGKM